MPNDKARAIKAWQDWVNARLGRDYVRSPRASLQDKLWALSEPRLPDDKRQHLSPLGGQAKQSEETVS